MIVEASKASWTRFGFKTAFLDLNSGILSHTSHSTDPMPSSISNSCDRPIGPVVGDLDVICCLTSSGTTGEPKMIYISSESVSVNIESLIQLAYSTNEGRPIQRVLQLSTFTFDPSLFELLAPIITGATLIMPSTEIRRQLKTHLHSLVGHTLNSSLIQMTPSMIRFVGAKTFKEMLPFVSVLMVGGEPFLAKQEAKDFFGESRIKVLGLYGITEVSIWANAYLLDVNDWIEYGDRSPVPLGFTMSETRLRLVASDGSELVLEELAIPPHPFYAEKDPTELPYPTRFENLECQLWIGSETRRCLLAGEVTPEIWRDTGDLVRLCRGYLYHVGRIGDVFKLMGKKVNAKEVEATIKQLEFVSDCVVLPFPPEDPLGLIASITTNNPERTELETDLANYCISKLPALLRPLSFHSTREFPLTRHNKVDKNAIYDFFKIKERLDPTSTDEAVKKLILDIWSKLLRLEPSVIEPDDHFMVIGSSIDVASFIALLTRSMPVKLEKDRNIRAKLFATVFHGSFQDVVSLVLGLLSRDEVSPLDSEDSEELQPEEPVTASVPTAVLPFRSVLCAKNISYGEPIRSKNTYYVPNSGHGHPGWKCAWRVDLNRCVDSGPVLGLDQQGSGFIYGASHSGTVVCLDFESGQVVWSVELRERVEAPTALSLTGVLLVPCYGGKLALLDAATGDMRHMLQLASVYDDLKSTPTVLGDKALLGTLDGYLHTMDLESGMTSRCNIGTSLSPIRTDIVVFQSYAVVCRRSGEITAFSLDLSTILWHHQPSSPTPIFSSPLVIAGIVFIINVKGFLEARLVSNGSLVWSFDAPSLVFSSPISFKLDDSDILCLGCDDGHLICLRAVDGSVLWRKHLNGRLFASPCLVDISSGDASLCATTTNGIVHLLSRSDGSSLADPFEVKSETFCSPVGWNNSLVMGFRDDHLYCFRYT